MTDNCDDNAKCTNIPGSFTCTCNEGFSGEGITCTGKYSYKININDREGNDNILHACQRTCEISMHIKLITCVTVLSRSGVLPEN